jgi:ribonuclease-3
MVCAMTSEPPGSGAPAGPDPGELLRALHVPLGRELLDRALTHRSFAYENGGLPTNERLEFLGDSVLGLVVTGTLYQEHPELQEGQLAKLRAAVVNMRALAGVARGLALGRHIKLGRGEEGTGGRDKSSILADTLEAIIGAVYLDCGLDEADRLVHRLFDPVIASSARLGAGLDWKTSLQELTAAEMLGVPDYHVTESGPDHQKSFRAVVRVGGKPCGSGEGRSKKEAEQQAAEVAWNAIRKESTLAADLAVGSADPAGTADPPSQNSSAGPAGAAGSADAADPGIAAGRAGPVDAVGSDGLASAGGAAGAGGSAGPGGAA